MKLLRTAIILLTVLSSCGKVSDRPNILIIYTDEHNFRTLGCYRALLPDDQAYVWGEGVSVETPNIDRLAGEGLLCTSFYAAAPVCTPSRAAFMTGLYPHTTGAPQNNIPMNDSILTFAQILQQNGYATGYVGKWHLDGIAKPGWEPARKFGWQDNRYMFNRGHWKVFADTADRARVVGSHIEELDRYIYDITAADEYSFATDFLADKTIDLIRAVEPGRPFCVMLSLPDPHGPNSVRAPYDTMYDHLFFHAPRTFHQSLESFPAWLGGGKNLIQSDTLRQKPMRQYFGMVKCIDDNVGKLMAFLEASGKEENTIVVFTSDHGDLMGEHRKHNKGNPYETSAGVAFLIKYPGKIRPGKIIHKAYTSADFAPTLLGLLGMEQGLPGRHGRNDSKVFLDRQAVVDDDEITYMRAHGLDPGWVAAVSDRYKLVLSKSDQPWLFDLEEDPDELTNFYAHPGYLEIATLMTRQLADLMAAAGDPLLQEEEIRKWLN
jgi:arylsulfatase A-like enzyme